MILKNNLYRILSADTGMKSFRLELIQDCGIYRAHFPEQPITPGVCIIQTASELLSELLSTAVELQSVSNAKFLAVIDPRETKNITYRFTRIVPDEDKVTLKVSATVSDNETTYTKLSLVYRKK